MLTYFILPKRVNMVDDISYDKLNCLISQTKAGETEAFNQIAERYRPLIEGCICYFCGKIDFEELEQEALIALYKAACTYDSGNTNVSFGLYAKICINNSLISLLKSYKKQKDTECFDTDENERFDIALDPSVDYINKESFLLLDRFIKEHLSDYEYTVFRLYIEGYKVKEIAQKLKKTEKSVEGAILRMRIKLRRSLSKNDL